MAFPRELEAWLHDTPVRSQEWAVQNSGNGKSLNGTGYVAVALSETGEPQRLPAGRVRVVVTLRDVHQSCARSRQLGAKLVEATRRQQALAAMIQESLAKIARGARSRATIDQRSV
jgi:hypothetical protein